MGSSCLPPICSFQMQTSALWSVLYRSLPPMSSRQRMRKPFLKRKNFLPSSLLSSVAAAQVNKKRLLCIAQEPFFCCVGNKTNFLLNFWAFCHFPMWFLPLYSSKKFGGDTFAFVLFHWRLCCLFPDCWLSMG